MFQFLHNCVRASLCSLYPYVHKYLFAHIFIVLKPLLSALLQLSNLLSFVGFSMSSGRTQSALVLSPCKSPLCFWLLSPHSPFCLPKSYCEMFSVVLGNFWVLVGWHICDTKACFECLRSVTLLRGTLCGVLRPSI